MQHQRRCQQQQMQRHRKRNTRLVRWLVSQFVIYTDFFFFFTYSRAYACKYHWHWNEPSLNSLKFKCVCEFSAFDFELNGICFISIASFDLSTVVGVNQKQLAFHMVIILLISCGRVRHTYRHTKLNTIYLYTHCLGIDIECRIVFV